MKKILILSDKLEASLLFEIIIQNEGYEFIKVSSTQQILDHLQSSNIGLLILCLPLSKTESGWDFYIDLRTDLDLPSLSIIIYTAWLNRDFSSVIADYGDTLFTMPVSVENFAAKVNEIMNLS